MSTQIKLDTQALNALFPEGSESRVNLSQAVIQNFVDRNFIKFGNTELVNLVRDNVTSKLRELPSVNDAISKEIQRNFISKGWNKAEMTPELSSIIKTEIQQKVSNMMTAHIDSVIKESLESHMGTLEDRIRKHVEFSVANMTKLASDHLAKNYKEILDAAIRAKLDL